MKEDNTSSDRTVGSKVNDKLKVGDPIYAYSCLPKDRLNKLKAVHAVQEEPGNWDANDYMRGMFNGLELATAIMEDREPKFKK
jgi:hypothetical protein